ncbi:arylsulfotransferase family protein [Frigidibacter sp. SD6-1]|uniref:arylsulfotransferase family protein n=1 Tax=Frigidibacter sp. SD6-1 TaxID=3032581 RepID=UPI0024DF5175|nr:arylsulfotransferase family protein [Frigidibacter sp. SD6-1]
MSEPNSGKAWIIPAIGALFLAFAGGLGLGVTGKPPAGLLKNAISGASEVYSYSRDALLARPSQHIVDRPRDGFHDGAGVTLSLPDEMQPGVTFVAGLFGQVLGFRLYAADGTLLKEWPTDFFKIAPDEMKHRYHALIHGDFLFPNGDVLANLDGRGLVRFDACGEIRWRNHDRSHHAIFVDDKGDIWTPIGADPVRELRIAPMPFAFDHLARFDPDTGAKLEEINLLDALLKGPGPGLVQADFAHLDDVLHINDVEVLSDALAPAFPMFKAGDVLVSSRNLSQLWVIDRESHAVKWWFAGPLRSQHDADFRPDGTISALDNRPAGVARASNNHLGGLGGSRILLIDPASGASRVAYQSDARNIFYTPFRGKQELEPNGNLLITETDGGRVFEVTPDGKPVWQFVNEWDPERLGWVMGAGRYPPDYAKIAEISCD